MIINLDETTEVTSMAKQFTSKMKNMNLHLKEILAKKLRLEIEIKSLKISIKEKQENYEKSLRVKLQLESSQYISSSELSALYEKDPSLANSLIQLEESVIAINETLSEIE
jgi:hypothetical protein